MAGENYELPAKIMTPQIRSGTEIMTPTINKVLTVCTVCVYVVYIFNGYAVIPPTPRAGGRVLGSLWDPLETPSGPLGDPSGAPGPPWGPNGGPQDGP